MDENDETAADVEAPQLALKQLATGGAPVVAQKADGEGKADDDE